MLVNLRDAWIKYVTYAADPRERGAQTKNQKMQQKIERNDYNWDEIQPVICSPHVIVYLHELSSALLLLFFETSLHVGNTDNEISKLRHNIVIIRPHSTTGSFQLRSRPSPFLLKSFCWRCCHSPQDFVAHNTIRREPSQFTRKSRVFW